MHLVRLLIRCVWGRIIAVLDNRDTRLNLLSQQCTRRGHLAYPAPNLELQQLLMGVTEVGGETKQANVDC